MKQKVWCIVHSLTSASRTEVSKAISAVYVHEFMVHDRMNEIAVEFSSKKDEDGNFAIDVDRPWWSIINCKSRKNDVSCRFEVVEREIEI